MHRLSEIQKEMQEATTRRDAQTIQALMAERSILLEEQQQWRLHEVPAQEQNVTAEGLLRRLSSRVAGFSGRQTTSISVTELMAEGYSRPEANAQVVARNKNEILMEAFECWICCFTLASICLTVLVTGLLLCHNRICRAFPQWGTALSRYAETIDEYSLGCSACGNAVLELHFQKR